MKRKPNIPEKISVYIIVHIHQRKFSPYLKKKGNKCRFYPSCSNYGLLAIEKYGFLKGWMKIIGRIFRCNSWNKDSHIDYP